MEYPTTSKDLSTDRLNELLSDFNQHVIEETFAALQGDPNVREYSKLEELELALGESQIDSSRQVQEEVNNLIEYKAHIEKLLELTNVLIVENAESTKSDLKVETFGELTTTVYNASGKLGAEMIRLFLESFGIRSQLIQESAGVTYGLTVGPLGLAEIRVSEEDSEQTREILQAMEEGIFILPDDNVNEFGENHLEV
jgi:hypothetical protein